MASKTQKNNGYLLPDPVDGYELICVKLMIPNDPTYIADFTGHLHEFAKWWTWEKSNVSGDTRATDAAAYWRKLLYTYLTIGDCGEKVRNCTDYLPSSPIFQYVPQDPFKQPDLTPVPYLLPPFTVVQSGDIVNTLLGYVPGDVITTITRIPLTFLTGGPVILYPTIKIDLPTGGDLTLKLLAIESGGLAEIKIDGVIKEVIDLEYLELQFPVQNTKETEFEVTLEAKQPHTVLITFLPKVMLTPPFIGFGGGLRSITFCTDETFNDALERAAKRLNAPYTEVDLEMPRLEVDCDCQAFIVCDDGTRKKLAYADDVPQIKAEVEGAPQPKAGGGTVDYCKHMTAKQRLLIPAPVSTGDTITIDDAKGAGTDGVDGAWRWINGQIYFAGLVGGDTITNGGDPVPTAPHMSLIINVGGTFYAFTAGSFTVPSGVSNAQVYIQINTADLTIADGDYDFCTTVTNNQAEAWEKVFNFALSPHSDVWAAYNSGGVSAPAATWIPGTGWSYSDYTQGGSNVRAAAIVSSTHIDHLLEFILEGNYVYGFLNPGTPYVQVLVNGTPIFTVSDPTSYPDGAKLHDIPADVTAVTGMLAFFESFVSNTARSGSCVISKITLRGIGTNPFA